MLLYAIRHAESVANVDRSAGLNSSLTGLGQQQAMAVAERLGRASVSALYCSPYVRCIETALPLARRLNLKIRVHPCLCEFHSLPTGAAEVAAIGSIEELAARISEIEPCPDWSDAFEWAPLDEKLEHLIARMQRFEAFLKKRWTSAGDVVVLISHGSPIARLIDAWLTDLPGPSFRFIIDNAAVNGLRFHEGVSSLICLNEVSHLSHLPRPAASNFTDAGLLKSLPPTRYW